MKFSIIVPIYNACNVLRRCLDSILLQTYPLYEVLMIDDGSTDTSEEIAAHYAEKDVRFILIRQSNAGPSKARNKGINLATGEVICFVDSDDFIESDYLQQLYNAFQEDNADVVFFGVNQLILTSGKTCIRNIPTLPKSKIDQIIELTNADLFGYTWVKAISCKIIGENRFDEYLNLFEDEVFTCKIMQSKPNISCVSKALYNQTVSPGSLSRKDHNDYYKKCEAVYLAWKQLLSVYPKRYYNVLQKKANHMALVNKFYYLEREIFPRQFALGLADCSFFQESTVDDKVITQLKRKKLAWVLFYRLYYRAKINLKKVCW